MALPFLSILLSVIVDIVDYVVLQSGEAPAWFMFPFFCSTPFFSLISGFVFIPVLFLLPFPPILFKLWGMRWCP
jgi:hypothetical protein